MNSITFATQFIHVSISIQSVSKSYGEQKALDNVSFEAGSGKILGFLGPNGAGKSTLMKIITTYIPPDMGEVQVCGYSIHTHPMDVRRNIGYLPEHNPLYTDMYVKEYLQFIAGIHKLSHVNKRVDEMIEQTGLGKEQNKKIAALSKGYRQRVGIAQALIHNPKVLILDEPTSGLDPNQLVEIRNLIKEAGKDKTVMFSTHIMQEVEAVCDRVIIINKGQMVADAPADELSKAQQADCIVVEFAEEMNQKSFSSLNEIARITHLEGNKVWEFMGKDQQDIRQILFQFAVNKGITILNLSRKEARLEDVFRKLTSGK